MAAAPAPGGVVVETSTKGRVLLAVAAGQGFDEMRRTIGLGSQSLVAALAALRSAGLVQYRDAHSSSGLTDLHLTKKGGDSITRLAAEVDAQEVAQDIIREGRGARMQPTLSPVAARTTLQTAVVSVPGKPGRTRQATDPQAHGSTAEGGPVTVRHTAPERAQEEPDVPASLRVVRDDHPEPTEPTEANLEAAMAAAVPMLDDLPLISALRGRESKRAEALEAAEHLMRAGLDDLAEQALAAVPDESPLETEVIRLLARVGW